MLKKIYISRLASYSLIFKMMQLKQTTNMHGGLWSQQLLSTSIFVNINVYFHLVKLFTNKMATMDDQVLQWSGYSMYIQLHVIQYCHNINVLILRSRFNFGQKWSDHVLTGMTSYRPCCWYVHLCIHCKHYNMLF